MYLCLCFIKPSGGYFLNKVINVGQDAILLYKLLQKKRIELINLKLNPFLTENQQRTTIIRGSLNNQTHKFACNLPYPIQDHTRRNLAICGFYSSYT